jgi:hypothetical protein
MAITITGLTPRQVLFADILWKCQGRDQVEAFIRGLPQTFQGEARVVLDMMVAAVFDDITETTMAQDLLSKYNK